MNNQVSHLALLCCAFPFVATACGGESPTEGAVVEVVQGTLLSVSGDGQVGNLGKPLGDSVFTPAATSLRKRTPTRAGRSRLPLSRST